jgi:glyoxylase I family protein
MTHRSLHHLAVGSSNVERLAAFYRDVVGLPELARHVDNHGALRSIWLNLGGPVLMIERTDADPRRVEGIGSGPFLLAFAVSPAQRHELEAALLANGQRIESRTAFTSYSRDVDGNRIAFSHYPDAAVVPDVPA